MKAFIDLEKTVLDFPTILGANEETSTVWDSSGRRILVADFATILVGFDRITDERWRESVAATLELETRKAPIFTAPETWTLAHVMKALGAFGSVGEAKRNGWVAGIEEGMSEHVCRIRKIRGAVTTFRPTATVLSPESWID